MAKKPTYKELEQEVKKLKKEAVKLECAGEVLKETESRLRYLLTTSPAVIYTCKPAGDFAATFIGENVKAQLGYKANEFVENPKFWADHIHPEDRPRVFAELPRVFEHGYYSHEYRFQKKDGTYRWMHDELRLLHDGQGNPMEIVGFWIDITSRRQADESLKKRTNELDERIKELNCLYGISHLVEEDGISLEEILQATADLLPLAWQYPEITCARITAKGQQFKTKNFRKTTWNQSGDIFVHGDRVGVVEVYYLEEKPEIDEGPFMKEERKLLDAVGQRVGRIIERRQAEESLSKAHDELKAKSHHLQEVNTALRVLLKQREHDKKELQENVLSNVKELVTPHFERLKKSRLDVNQTALVSILESNLNNIVSPFVGKLSSKFLALTPTEIRVADLVKEGKTNKDIAELLPISKNTVLYHRYNIRTKLGLRNRKINLRSYLLSLAK
jgi:PAS domain S-box-containing protein